jgi:nucleotide-binding universal stress UspA family protein
MATASDLQCPVDRTASPGPRTAGLLIIGRRGKDFVARTLLGSVATRLVEQAPCDVLVVA